MAKKDDISKNLEFVAERAITLGWRYAQAGFTLEEAIEHFKLTEQPCHNPAIALAMAQLVKRVKERR